jgi:FAD/FMN-containing dehydrogenase
VRRRSPRVEFDAPVLSRRGRTSLAGQCTNAAVVINWTKYCDKLVSVVVRRTCVVEPGILPEELNLQLSGYQPKFGAKPSTHSHCSLAG